MSYVFGPVPSGRLGQSLGIDPVPLKTCNFSCVYCQLGRTKPLAPERREYIPARAILRQCEDALTRPGHGKIDWLTLVGSGETTLHSRLGWLIRQIKQKSTLPLAVITNSSLLHLSEVRDDLRDADAVLPSLDAGTPELFRQITRPHPTCSFAKTVKGLIAFRRAYLGKLFLEIMIVRGMNDSERALDDIAAVVRDIEPDEIHINEPTRPPAELWVQPPEKEGLERAFAILGNTARVVPPANGNVGLGLAENLEESVLDIITRHPMRLDELERCRSDWAPAHVRSAVASLIESRRAQQVERNGSLFFSAIESYFPKLS